MIGAIIWKFIVCYFKARSVVICLEKSIKVVINCKFCVNFLNFNANETFLLNLFGCTKISKIRGKSFLTKIFLTKLPKYDKLNYFFQTSQKNCFFFKLFQ